MIEKHIRVHNTINDIKLSMIRKGDNCWIKIVPINRQSTPSSLHIILNGEDHHWDIYDENRIESHKVYFEGYKSTPSFYLKSGEDRFRIDFDIDKIIVLQITENHRMDTYLETKCHCISSKASCWAVSLYYTSRPEKTPFNEM